MLMPQLVPQLRIRDNPRDRFYGKLQQVLSQFPITERKFCQISMNNFGRRYFYAERSGRPST
jgi:hypothetical protein